MLFDLLNHRGLALSLPIGIASKGAVPPNRETFAPRRPVPWGWYGKKEEQSPVFLPQERGTRLLWTTRFGQPHSLLVLPPGGESDHHYLIFGGLLSEKESPKSYSKGLRLDFSAVLKFSGQQKIDQKTRLFIVFAVYCLRQRK